MRRLGRTQRAREEECTGVCCLLLIDKARAKDYICIYIYGTIGAGAYRRRDTGTCGASAHDALPGGPRRLGRWSQPAFGAGSAPRDPEARLGRDWRAGTIGAGAYRRRRTGMLVKKKRKDLPYILLSLALDLSINNKQHTPVHFSSLVLCVLPKRSMKGSI
jgi:hypothetical protein